MRLRPPAFTFPVIACTVARGAGARAGRGPGLRVAQQGRAHLAARPSADAEPHLPRVCLRRAVRAVAVRPA